MLGDDDDRSLAAGAVPPALTVAFRDEPVPAAVGAVVRFGRRRHADHEMLIAPAGKNLWRRSPWPAADDLFDLPPATGDGVLVVGGEPSRRAAVTDRIRARGVQAGEASRIQRALLERFATVAVLADLGRFPDQAFAVAAAARLLLLVAPDATFGLHDGVDCLIAPDDEALVDLLDTAATYGAAFDAVRRSGRVTAASQRASDVYARLATDVELGRVGVERK